MKLGIIGAMQVEVEILLGAMNNKTECVAMLLAGGQGSRLYALTTKTAKPAVRRVVEWNNAITNLSPTL